MKGAIATLEYSTDYGGLVIIDVDAANFSKETSRVITKARALNSTIYTTDWGFAEGDRMITMNNIFISKNIYDLIVAMREDTANRFLFHYNVDSWEVIVQNVAGPVRGNKRLANITLSVVSKYGEYETS